MRASGCCAVHPTYETRHTDETSVAPKTKKDKLRGTKRRRQAARKFGKFLITISIILGLLAAVAYGAWRFPAVKSAVKWVMRGGRAGTYEFSSDYRQVGLNTPFDFAGGTLTLEKVRTTEVVRSVFGGGPGNEPAATFKAKRGVWLIVSAGFRGNPSAARGRMDPGSVKLVDEDANVYVNEALGSPAEDLYYEEDAVSFGRLDLANPEPQRSLLIFDVSPKARGLLLVFLREEVGQMKAIRGARLSFKGQ